MCTRRRLAPLAAVLALATCREAGDTGSIPTERGPSSPTSVPGSSRGFPQAAPWLSFYGTAREMGDPARVAATFRIINVDADPGDGNFTPAEISVLKDGGRNRVISYLNVGSCEEFRTYWRSVPAGFVSCGANQQAQLGRYQGFPDEVWMDPANADYRKLIVEYVAPRLAAQGVDGFFLDNLELLEHGTNTTNGPCDPACRQAGLDLVGRLRDAFPGLLIVMQNATGTVTRLGSTTDGRPYPSLLDGVSHEEVYAPNEDAEAESELLAWQGLGLRPGGRSFWIGTEDYVGSCGEVASARAAYERSRARGFSPYATDDSGGQRVVCYWPF